jgi:hypothetical protein
VSVLAATTTLGATDTLRCPGDDFEFRPYYSDGVCPLCGWAPAGVIVGRPWSQRLDWLVVAVGALVLFAVLMTVLVVNKL